MKKKLKKNYTKIGILGGTFDPPHKGHIYISKIAIKKLRLNKLIWAITKKNPLKKKPYLKKNIRIKLSKKITRNEKKILVKYYEDKLKSANTYRLLIYLKKRNKNTKLFFLMGADNLQKFHKWRNWKNIVKLSKIVIFPRANYSIKSNILNKLGKNHFILIKSRKINISSSLIRKLW